MAAGVVKQKKELILWIKGSNNTAGTVLKLPLFCSR
jgi:hypothetical protein